MTSKKKPAMKISGIIERVHFSSDKFSAAKLRVTNCTPPHEKIKPKNILGIAGKFIATDGENITVEGETQMDPKWGLQFKVSGVCLSTDLSSSGLQIYLEKNKNFRGIGPAKAKLLVKHIVDNNLDRTATMGDADALCATGIISKEQAAVVANEWNMSEAENGVLSELMKYNLTLNQAKKCFSILGTLAVDMVNKNPYSLIDLIDGVGFLTIDKIAIANGMPVDSEYRIDSAIKFALKENEQKGSSGIKEMNLVTDVDCLLNCDDPKVRGKIQKRVDHGVEEFSISKITQKEKDDSVSSFYARTKTFEKEKKIVELLSELKNNFGHNGYISSDSFLNARQSVLSISPMLNENQADAAANALLGSVIITGGAGTGKTYTLQSIMSALPDKSFLLAAPTGKAARRIEQSLIDGGYVDTEGRQMTAQTVHRLLQYDPLTQSFMMNEYQQFECDYIIVDEFSMMDISLTHSLLKAINPKTTRLIMVGDHHQLPSVGCGNVLKDAIDLNLLTVCKLEMVMRQGGVLKENSNAVLDGKVKPTENDPENSKSKTQWVVSKKCSDSVLARNMILYLLNNKRFEENGFNALQDVQFLSPMRKGPLGTLELNKMLQTVFQLRRGVRIVQTEEGKNYNFYVGDKIIQTKNDYDIDVMNGTLGFIVDIVDGDFLRIEDGTGSGTRKEQKFEDQSSKYFVVEFETGQTVRIKKGGEKYRNIELSYVLTVHKVQGSEFPCVVVICHKLHNFMHHRGLLYTAVTRAKKSVIIIGDKWGIENCGRKVLSDKRVTLAPIIYNEGKKG